MRRTPRSGDKGAARAPGRLSVVKSKTRALVLAGSVPLGHAFAKGRRTTLRGVVNARWLRRARRAFAKRRRTTLRGVVNARGLRRARRALATDVAHDSVKLVLLVFRRDDAVPHVPLRHLPHGTGDAAARHGGELALAERTARFDLRPRVDAIGAKVMRAAVQRRRLRHFDASEQRRAHAQALTRTFVETDAAAVIGAAAAGVRLCCLCFHRHRGRKGEWGVMHACHCGDARRRTTSSGGLPSRLLSITLHGPLADSFCALEARRATWSSGGGGGASSLISLQKATRRCIRPPGAANKSYT